MMIVEDPEVLRTWLTSYLEPLCEADPEALAKYVMALIKKDKPEEELRSICLDQLEVFLQKETQPFVNVFFEKLHDKSYIAEVAKKNAAAAAVTQQPPSSSTTVTPPSSNTNNVPSSNTSSLATANNSSSQPSTRSDQTATSAESAPASQKRSSQNVRDPKRDKRSRSRTRSPSGRTNRKLARNDVDMRDRVGGTVRGSGYSSDDRGGRRDVGRGGARRRPQQPMHRRPGDRRRSRSLSRSRSRSKSPSRSRSRSPDRKRSGSRSRETGRSQSPGNSVVKQGKRERCRDFDEVGFCMKGELCPFDHGAEPIILDNTSSQVLGMGQNGVPLLPTPGGTVASQQGQPNQNWAEPYNPEAPAIEGRRPMPVGGPPMGHQPQPYGWGGLVRGPPARGGGPAFHQGSQQPNVHGPGRPRELSVITPQEHEQQQHHESRHDQHHQHTNRTVLDPGMMSHHRGRGGRGRGFGRGRGRGFGKRVMATEQPEKCTLEIRKLPNNLNTISHLNEHFSKFGTIVNLQVCYEGDPEAALVQFASYMEARAAHQCTDAVMNNRFIKVFWHSKDQQQSHEQVNSGDNVNGGGAGGQDEPRKSVKDRIAPRPDEEEQRQPPAPIVRSKPVTDPSLLKMDKKKLLSGGLYPMIKTKSEQKKENVLKSFELLKKRQELLSAYMRAQKGLLVKMEQAKDKAEKMEIRASIMDIAKKIKDLEETVRKGQSNIKSMVGGGVPVTNVLATAGNAPVAPVVSIGNTNQVVDGGDVAEKHVLDMDLELYKKQRSDIE